VPRSTYYRLRSEPEDEAVEDPIADAVEEEFRRSGGRYGARRIKKVLIKHGIVASRRRIAKIMKSHGLASCYTKADFRPHPDRTNEAELPNVLNREFDGHAPRTHIVSDLTYVRVLGSWCYICLLIDLYNREIVGHAAGAKKDASLVKAAFATVSFPLFDIDVFHSDRGSEFDNAALDELFEVFGITRSLSKKGCPYDNAVDESTNKTLKAEFVYQEQFSSLHDLQVKLNDYVWWYNNERMHSTLGYMSPVEFRKAGLSL
jgi:transposase InsO family protein